MVTSFSKRWTNHRYTWKTAMSNEEQNASVGDETALAHHFFKIHPQTITAKSSLSENYFVQFVERPNPNKLDISENFWISTINTKININITFLPKLK